MGALHAPSWSRSAAAQCVRATLVVALGAGTCGGCVKSSHAEKADAGTAPEAAFLTSVETEPAGDACAYGGQRVRAGIDANADGVLQAEEVRAATVVCQADDDAPGDDRDADDDDAGVAGTSDAGVPDAAVPSSDAGATAEACKVGPHQGATTRTDSPLDLALAGPGFFVLRGPSSMPSLRFYTRFGRFHIDPAGYLVDAHGFRAQGHVPNAMGALSLELSDLPISLAPLAAAATNFVQIAVNLDATTTPAPAWDPLQPDSTSNFNLSLTLFDSLGAGHMAHIFFAKHGVASWDWYAGVHGGEINGGQINTLFVVATGQLTFSNNGALLRHTAELSTWSFVGNSPQTIAFDFGASIEDDNSTGLAATTQFASASGVNSMWQDGSGVGALSAVLPDEAGFLIGVYTNGQRRALGQLVVAAFLSTDGLTCTGHEHWINAAEAGEPLLGAAGSVGHGVVLSGAIEQ